jgi:hypothetical protein
MSQILARRGVMYIIPISCREVLLLVLVRRGRYLQRVFSKGLTAKLLQSNGLWEGRRWELACSRTGAPLCSVVLRFSRVAPEPRLTPGPVRFRCIGHDAGQCLALL